MGRRRACCLIDANNQQPFLANGNGLGISHNSCLGEALGMVVHEGAWARGCTPITCAVNSRGAGCPFGDKRYHRKRLKSTATPTSYAYAAKDLHAHSHLDRRPIAPLPFLGFATRFYHSYSSLRKVPHVCTAATNSSQQGVCSRLDQQQTKINVQCADLFTKSKCEEKSLFLPQVPC
eukprot:scaffold2529_cov122-Isochrysis_galbana.AAC.6